MPVMLLTNVRGGLKALQRGFGLLEAALVTLLLGGALVSGYLALRSHQASEAAQRIQTVLAQADREIAGFAAVHERLPCPDVNRDGLEDYTVNAATGVGTCSTTAQKGWLPYRTLGMEGAQADSAVTDLQYLVQRGAVELAQRADLYEPVAFVSPAPPASKGYLGQRTLNQISTADFCQGLQTANALVLAATHARFGVDPDARPLAYAVVHPGSRDADGNGSLFDGLHGNAANTLAVERPERGSTLGAYDDVVRVRTYASLSASLDCGRLLQSLDVLSLATEVTEEVMDQKDSTRLSAILTSTINGVKILVAGLKVGLAIMGMATAIAHLVAASGELTAAIASCFVLVGCALIPKAIAAVIASTAAIAAFGVAIGLTAAAATASTVAMILSSIAAAKAGAEVASAFNVDQAKADALANHSAAQARTTSTYNDLQARIGERTTSLNELNTARNNLNNRLAQSVSQANGASNCNPSNPAHTGCFTVYSDHYSGTVSLLESRYNTFIAADVTLEERKRAYQKAVDATSNPPAGSGVPTTAIETLQKKLNPSDPSYETDATQRARIQEAIDYLQDPANQPSNTSNAAMVSQVTTNIAALTTRIGEIDTLLTALNAEIGGASCTPTPSVDPLKSQCEQRALYTDARSQAVSQRDLLTNQLNHMTLDVATAQSLRDTAQTTRDQAWNPGVTSPVNDLKSLMASIPYRYCTSTTTTTGSGSSAVTVTTWTCETRSLNRNDGDLNGKINDFMSKLDRYALKNEGVRQAQAIYDQARVNEQDALNAKNAVDAISTGTTGAGVEITPWQGAADILKLADRKGGVR